MAGKTYNIEKLSYLQIEALDRGKTIVLLAISPLEEHGPHLPVGVDAFNAWYFANHTAEMVIKARPDYDVLLFPLLPLGTQVYKHIGSFYIKPETLYDIVYNTGRSIARYGFANIFVINAHGTPKQFVAIESACRSVSKKENARMVSLSGGLAAKLLSGELWRQIALKLGREFTAKEIHLLKHDYHAGWWETSMALLTNPELVDKSYNSLTPYLQDFISKKILTPDKEWQGYYGAPAKADTDFAKASVEVFAEQVRDMIFRSIAGEDIAGKLRSPFYKYPIFHPFFKRNIVIAGVALITLFMLILIIKAYL